MQEIRFKTQFFLLFGVGFFISVGYLDPGNWATDIAAGSEYGYQLIWVILFSNIIAMVLQSFCVYLGVYAEQDLAQACRSSYKKGTSYILWILAELAIIACDLAELLGTAIALNLLFHIPYMIGILLTALDTFIVLLLETKGFRKLHAIIVGLVLLIAVAFMYELLISKPDIISIASGLNPEIPDLKALSLGIGILGATVMPHNLYLHSALVKNEFKKSSKKKRAKKLIKDIIFALSIALIVNAGILILSATAFYMTGHSDVASIQDAYILLEPTLGKVLAPIVFAVALLLAGQASTITGTLAGQVVMEGFIHIKLKPWKRRLLTRTLAIVPAVLFIGYYGSENIDSLLIISQIFLGLQLPFAVIPLLLTMKNKKQMNNFKINNILYGLGILFAVIIVVINLTLIYSILGAISIFLAYSILLAIIIFILYIIYEYIVINKNYANK